MKFHQSTVLKNIDQFPGDGLGQLPRDNNDMLQMWRVCEYFQPTSVLEIGFSAGQTFGLFLESTAESTRYVAVDNDFARNYNIFEAVFGNHPKRNQIEMLNIDSRDLALTDKFDFIHIDANHEYEFVLNDLMKCLPLLHEGSILCMDDTLDIGVDRVIREHLTGQHKFIPFLAGNKQIFFCHESRSVKDFVRNYLREGVDNFAVFDNWEHYNQFITKMHVVNFVENNFSIFLKAVQTYDI